MNILDVCTQKKFLGLGFGLGYKYFWVFGLGIIPNPIPKPKAQFFLGTNVWNKHKILKIELLCDL